MNQARTPITRIDNRPACIVQEWENPVLLHKGLSYMCKFEPTLFNTDHFLDWSIKCPKTISSAVAKRQSEFFTGRYAAKVAQEKLTGRSSQVSIGASRQPIWPDGLIGSITHNCNHALCFLAFEKDYRFFGVDLESWMNEETVRSVREGILNVRENRWLNNPHWSLSHTLTLLFSIKESLYKAIFNEVNKFFDFSAASIIQLDLENGTFQLKLEYDLSQTMKKDMRFDGHFSRHADFVLTYIAISR